MEQPRPAAAGRRPALSVEEYAAGIRAGDRAILGRAFSLMESTLPAHHALAQQVLEAVAPHARNSRRIGVSGIPGVGKSTFIESLGMRMLADGARVAVLAVDPSSERSGGSILGDKTRMERLALHPSAFVRPTAAGRMLGGVARGTRDSIALCEAAGFDTIFVETVGVGQSETEATTMTDFFLLLMLPGAGDELQGIKRGIIELADAVVVNKCDGDNRERAREAKVQLEGALRLLHLESAGPVPVLLASSLTSEGIDAVQNAVDGAFAYWIQSGELEARRRAQAARWLRRTVERAVLDEFFAAPGMAAAYAELEARVGRGELSPFLAAEQLLQRRHSSTEDTKR